MDLQNLFKNYTKSAISSQILKSPYEEIYNQIFNINNSYETILILNQNVYIPLAHYFETIFKKEYYITYIDNNELSINQLNNEIIQFKNEEKKSLDLYIHTLLSTIYTFKNMRTKDIKYDIILIHHYNSYINKKTEFFNVLNSIVHKNSEIILFASICDESKNIDYKNKIRNQISQYTNMDIGTLYSLEEIILSIPQKDFKIKHIIPYRESYYLGYGKNMIYKFILAKE